MRASVTLASSCMTMTSTTSRATWCTSLRRCRLCAAWPGTSASNSTTKTQRRRRRARRRRPPPPPPCLSNRILRVKLRVRQVLPPSQTPSRPEMFPLCPRSRWRRLSFSPIGRRKSPPRAQQHRRQLLYQTKPKHTFTQSAACLLHTHSHRGRCPA